MIMGKPVVEFVINWNKITSETRSSWLKGVLRGDEAVYWVSNAWYLVMVELSQYEAVIDVVVLVEGIYAYMY